MKLRQPLLFLLFIGVAVASVALWRRNVIELAELRKQPVPSPSTSPQMPPGTSLVLIEENKKTRPMTMHDLQDIEAKTQADLKNKPDNPDLRLQLSVTLSLKRRYDEAAHQLETAARLAPRNVQVRKAAGEFYMRFGDAQAALPHFKAARQLAPNDMEGPLNLAKAYSTRGEQEKALSLLETASRLAGSSITRQEELAGACTELSLRPNSVRAWRAVLKLQPNHALALQQMAYYELDGGNLSAAKAMLEKALLTEKEQPSLYSLLGTLYVSSAPTIENLKLAEINLNKALEMNENDSITHYYLGKVFQRRNNLVEAASQMEKAISLDPNYREAHYDLAQIYAAQKRLAEAQEQRKAFQKIFQAQNQRKFVGRRCQTSPDDPILQRDFAKLLFNAQDLVAALPHLQKALELRPNWKEVHQKIVEIHRLMGRPGEAKKIEKQIDGATKNAKAIKAIS